MNLLERLAEEAKKRARGVAAQVNTRDGGATYSTVVNNKPPVKPAQQQGIGVLAPKYNPGLKAQNDTSVMGSVKRVGNQFRLGATRSLLGNIQGVSGLVDLASPGTGTSRVSKFLDRNAQGLDQQAKNAAGDRGYLNNAYKVSQGLTDAGSILGGAGIAKLGIKAASKAPLLARGMQTVDKVTKPVANLNNRVISSVGRTGPAGRIAATGIKAGTNPANAASMAAGVGLDLGAEASKGRDISKGDVAASVAANVGLGVGLPVLGAAGKEAALQLRKKAFNDAGKTIKPQTVSTSKLDAQDAQGYGDLDPIRVSHYKNEIANGRAVEPLIVMKSKRGVMPVEDGKHRLQAYKELGITDVPAKVVTQSDLKKLVQNMPVGLRTQMVDDAGNPTTWSKVRAERQARPATVNQQPQIPPPPPEANVSRAPASDLTARDATVQQKPQVSAAPTSPDLGDNQTQVSLPSTDSLAQAEQRVFNQNPMSDAASQQQRNTIAKSFDLNDAGELVENTQGMGAYKLEVDEGGNVQRFRVGDEVFEAKDLGNLSDVNGYGSVFATMRRNIERGFGKETSEKVNRFLVDHQQAQATKLIDRRLALNTQMRQIADDLGISFGIGRRQAKKVSASIQKYGEGNIDEAQLVKEFGPDQAAKIIKADQWFRTQYDTLLDEMNDQLVKFGYDPVPKRENYYTHFSEPSLWEKFGLKMQEVRDLANPTMQDSNPSGARGMISNKMAGQSEYSLPNKAFNRFALRREGEAHTDDAFQAFEKYLTPTLNNIYMTPSITRARVLSRAIAQQADTDKVDANKLIVQLREWANSLSGKSNRFGDRQLSDTMLGGKYLNAVQWAQRQAGANSIVGNLATAALQPVVLAQTTGKNGFRNTMLAAAQELSTAHSKNAPIRQSEFMKRRYSNLTPVTATKRDRGANIANKPLQVVEETVARITWNASYNDALGRGLRGKPAIQYADVQTEKTLAGRSIGERPEIFMSKTAGPATMYQLEVGNYWQQLGEMSTPQKLRTFLAAYLIGTGLQQIIGRDVGFNPIDAVIDSYGTLTDDELSAKEKAIQTAQRLGGEVVDNVPVVPQLAATLAGNENVKKVLGPDSNIGRFGVSSPISSLFSTTNVGGVPIPQNLILPFGGGQVKKMYESFNALQDGGIEDKNGNQKVAIDASPADTARGMLFGKSAIPEVNKYYEGIGKKKDEPTGASEELKMSDRLKQAFTTPEGKAMIALKTDKEREEQYPELYEQYKNVKKAFDPSFAKPKNYKDLDSNVRAHYAMQAGLNDEGKKNWEGLQASGESQDLIRRINQIRAKDMPELPATNKVASLYADFVAKRTEQKWSKTREVQEKRKLLKEAYKSSLSEDDTFWLGAGDGLFREGIEAGDIDEDMLKRMVSYDNLNVQLGGSQQVGKKLRSLLGIAQPPSSGPYGGSKAKTLSYKSFNSPLADLVKYSTAGANIARTASLR